MFTFSQGPAGIFGNWSPYVLLLSGAVALFLASNAFQAGSLAASQPGLTIVDPLVARTLGVVLFGERFDLGPAALGGEILALILVLVSVIMLSRSPLVHTEEHSTWLSPVPPRRIDRSGAWILVLSQAGVDARRPACHAQWCATVARKGVRAMTDLLVRGQSTIPVLSQAPRRPSTTWLACAGALAYCSWPLAFLVNPSLAGNGLASSFEAPSQPFSWLFILLDCIAAVVHHHRVYSRTAPPSRAPKAEAGVRARRAQLRNVRIGNCSRRFSAAQMRFKVCPSLRKSGLAPHSR